MVIYEGWVDLILSRLTGLSGLSSTAERKNINIWKPEPRVGGECAIRPADRRSGAEEPAQMSRSEAGRRLGQSFVSYKHGPVSVFTDTGQWK